MPTISVFGLTLIMATPRPGYPPPFPAAITLQNGPSLCTAFHFMASSVRRKKGRRRRRKLRTLKIPHTGKHSHMSFPRHIHRTKGYLCRLPREGPEQSGQSNGRKWGEIVGWWTGLGKSFRKTTFFPVHRCRCVAQYEFMWVETDVVCVYTILSFPNRGQMLKREREKH